MEIFTLKSEFIELDRLLKATGIADSGGRAHILSDEGKVKVDGVVDTRRRAKIRNGQTVSVPGRSIRVQDPGTPAP